MPDQVVLVRVPAIAAAGDLGSGAGPGDAETCLDLLPRLPGNDAVPALDLSPQQEAERVSWSWGTVSVMSETYPPRSVHRFRPLRSSVPRRDLTLAPHTGQPLASPQVSRPSQ